MDGRDYSEEQIKFYEYYYSDMTDCVYWGNCPATDTVSSMTLVHIQAAGTLQ